MATAISVCTNPGPSAATTAMASTGAGSARKPSVIRIRMVSSSPPRVPAARPISPPMTRPDAITARAANQLDRQPISTRDRMSRPMLSVPSRKPDEPGGSWGRPTGWIGLCGASTGASSAMAVTGTSSPAAAQSSGLLPAGSRL
jgi:hypothetical protein